MGDPHFERTPYDRFIAYGRSKTANILFAVAFDWRHWEHGGRAAAVHPGVIQTRAWPGYGCGQRRNPSRADQHATGSGRRAAVQWNTVPQGAATSVWAGVVAPVNEIGGAYCENCHVGMIVPEDVVISTVSERVRAYALDRRRRRRCGAKVKNRLASPFGGPRDESVAQFDASR